MRLIAHRGAAAEAPENSMTALELGMELGADAIELDVRRTADGALVVIHDGTLDRTTDRTGSVVGMTLAEIGMPSAVPRLADVFDRFPSAEITVDVKDPEAAADVVKLVETLDRVDRTILYVEDDTESEEFASYAGRRATSTRQALRFALDRGWAGRAATREIPEVLHTPERWWGISIVTQDFVRRVHDSGRTIQVWTVNDLPAARRLAGWSADAIITDDVRAMRAEFPRSSEGGSEIT